jgi:phosphoglycerate kinase
MTLPDIREAEGIRGKRALLRAPLNVPVENVKVMNDFRLRRTLNTIRFLKERGAKTIIIGHIGRDQSESLFPVYERMKQYIELTFVKSLRQKTISDAVKEMKDGDVILLENLRQDNGERSNSDAFARFLSSFGDIYVNDAFSVSHREHASIVGIPKYIPSYAGISLQMEIEGLSKALNPPRPAVFILGGAKFETKEPLIRKFLDIYDNVFLGGALANDFFKAQGFNVGKSLVSGAVINLEGLLGNSKLILPADVTVEHGRGGRRSIKKPNDIDDEDTISDIGPETVSQLKRVIKQSAFVLWNGPVGDYEKGFSEQTEAVARIIAGSSIESIVGGGHTVASISRLNIEDEFSFVSTGGGAMLEFLLNGTLPGLEALKNSKLDKQYSSKQYSS